jgi:hypothetical protein
VVNSRHTITIDPIRVTAQARARVGGFTQPAHGAHSVDGSGAELERREHTEKGTVVGLDVDQRTESTRSLKRARVRPVPVRMVGPAVPAGPTALGQRLAHRPFGLALPIGNRLVEHSHDLELVTSPGAIKETLVLESADAPTEWDFPMRLSGLTASLDAGSVWLRDSSGLASNSVEWTNLLGESVRALE